MKSTRVVDTLPDKVASRLKTLVGSAGMSMDARPYGIPLRNCRRRQGA